jgi:hypothetical protein
VGRTRAPHVHLKEGPSHYKQGALRLVEMKKKKKKKKKKNGPSGLIILSFSKEAIASSSHFVFPLVFYRKIMMYGDLTVQTQI